MARFVLVHGAFCGAWIWGPLIERLQAAGHSVEAFDLPGLGNDNTPVSEVTLDACAARLCAVLADHSEPAIVVGHSMGGIIATQGAACCPRRIAALVYVTAFLPKDGQSLLDLTKLPEGAGDQVQANIVIIGDPPVAIMPPEVSRPALYDCCAKDVAAWAIATTAPATGRAICDAGIHPARSHRRHQPVLCRLHAGSSYGTSVTTANDRRESVRGGGRARHRSHTAVVDDRGAGRNPSPIRAILVRICRKTCRRLKRFCGRGDTCALQLSAEGCRL